MKPLHFLALLPLTLIGLFVADKDAVSAREDEKGDMGLRQFQRDLPLIESLVEHGLDIAAEEDALKRALVCNRLAECFAKEVRQAASKKEVARVADLSNHLQEVLTRGVAGNVALARTSLPPDSPRTTEVEKITGLVNSVMKPVEDDLEGFPPSADKLMTGILAKMQQARTDVENAVKGKDKGKGKGKGKDRDRDRKSKK